MKEKKAIVTLLDANGSDLGDYELALDQRAERLYPSLIETLCRYALRFERCEITLCVREDQTLVPIPAKDTLAEHDVQDGSYLYVRSGGNQR